TNWVTAETSAASQTACGKLMTSPKRAEPRAAINLGLGALHIYHVCFGLSGHSIRAPKCPLSGVKRTCLFALQMLCRGRTSLVPGSVCSPCRSIRHPLVPLSPGHRPPRCPDTSQYFRSWCARARVALLANCLCDGKSGLLLFAEGNEYQIVAGPGQYRQSIPRRDARTASSSEFA